MRQKIIWLAAVAALAILTKTNAQNLPRPGKNSIKDVIAAITSKEKLQLIADIGMKLPGTNNGTGVSVTEDNVAGVSVSTAAVPRLGIPSVAGSDRHTDSIPNNDHLKVFHINDLKTSRPNETSYINDLNNFYITGQ